MLPTIHQRTQLDDSYEYPAVLVLVPSDSYYTIILARLTLNPKEQLWFMVGTFSDEPASLPPKEKID